METEVVVEIQPIDLKLEVCLSDPELELCREPRDLTLTFQKRP